MSVDKKFYLTQNFGMQSVEVLFIIIAYMLHTQLFQIMTSKSSFFKFSNPLVKPNVFEDPP